MHPTRQKLLDTGLAIATEKGLRGLTVRELAAAAEVNLGSFVYHFGNRDAFIEELVELWYAPLYDELKSVAAKGSYPSAIAMFEATMEALIGLWRASAALSTTCLAMRWQAKGRPSVFCSACRAAIPCC